MDIIQSSVNRQRSSLHRKTPSLSSYQITPISKHYEVNEHILRAFDAHNENGLYQSAYALGLQFVETAVLEIPKHGYFYSSRHERDRMRSALEAVRVIQLLEKIQQEGDFSDSEISSLKKLAALAHEQVQQASEDQYESHRAQAEQEIRHDESMSSSWVICEPFLLSCQESITSLVCPQPEVLVDDSEVLLPEKPDRSVPLTLNRSRTAPAWMEPRLIMESNTLNESSSASIVYPPEGLIRSVSEDAALRRALFLSGLQVQPEMDSIKEDELRFTEPEKQSKLEWSIIPPLYHEDFDQLRKSGSIRISLADTYQGRMVGSINGCTVIAPLLCIHHLLDDNVPDPGLPDSTIIHTIDYETPAILSQLRANLGLSSQAFLIPSDAHDFLIDNGQFSQSQFVNVVGGNILDDSHVDKFVRMIEDSKQKKISATLYFHEHVIAILHLRRGEGPCWFDWIDSLPLKSFLARPNERAEDFIRRLGLDFTEAELSDALVPKTARIRCLNTDALKACIRWYACSKMSPENLSYIDNYDWDELQSDFDPRVFQAFVWGDT